MALKGIIFYCAFAVTCSLIYCISAKTEDVQAEDNDLRDIPEFLCPALYGLYPHPTDCSKYYICRLGLAYEIECSRNMYYDKVIEVCRDKSKVKCDKDSEEPDPTMTEEPSKDPDFKCPKYWGTFPDPEDCSKYYVCAFRIPSSYQCRKSQLFDIVSQSCQSRDIIDCEDRWDKDKVTTTTATETTSTEEPFKEGKFLCPGINGLYPHPTNCSKYYLCRLGIAHEIECSRNMYYDKVIEVCRDKSKVKCDKEGEEPGAFAVSCSSISCNSAKAEDVQAEDNELRGVFIPKFFCPALYGLFPHPTDCRKYYQCRWGLAYELECSRNKYFDKDMEVCRDKSKVKCDKDGVDPEPTTTEEPSKDRDFKCPKSWGTFPDPEDCSKYYVCGFSIAASFQCRKTQLFDIVSLRCRRRDIIDCGDRWDKNQITTTTTTTETTETSSTEEPFKEGKFKFFCPFRQGRYADRNDCAQYYECRFFFAWPRRCPRSTLYDERKEECVEAKNARCGNRPGGSGGKEPEPEVVKCPYVFGTFSHPTDCSKYIICLYNVPTIIPCRRFELFNAFFRRCADRNGVNCQNRKNPDDDPDQVTESTTPEVTDSTTTTVGSTTTKEPTTTESTTTDTPTVTDPTTTVTEETTTMTNVPPPNDCEEDDVDCIIDETGDIIKWFTCPERYGQFPHLGSRELFIYCSNWKPSIKRCASGTYFSLTYLVCSASDM